MKFLGIRVFLVGRKIMARKVVGISPILHQKWLILSTHNSPESNIE